MKISAREKALLEHYVLATITAAVAIYQTGNHNIKDIVWAALVGVIGPVIARINPKSLVNQTLPVTEKEAKPVAPVEAVAPVTPVVTPVIPPVVPTETK